MKILGCATKGYERDTFIAEVSRNEIEKFMDLYYSSTKLKIEVGDIIDLSRGYDFYRKTVNAIEQNKKFLESQKAVIEVIQNGFKLLNNKDVDE